MLSLEEYSKRRGGTKSGVCDLPPAIYKQVAAAYGKLPITHIEQWLAEQGIAGGSRGGLNRHFRRGHDHDAKEAPA